MIIVAVDPGPVHSAVVKISNCNAKQEWEITAKDKMLNDMLLEILSIWATLSTVTFVIEMVASYGMPVGKDVFETVRWIGRFEQAVCSCPVHLVYRKDIKMMLCDRANAKDANIRQALIDRWGRPGTKKSPGPTFGFSGDMWSALAVATYWVDRRKMDAYEARIKEFKTEGDG